MLRVLLLAALLLAGCGGTKEPETAAVEPVPDTYKVRFDTSKGPFVVEVYKAWAPEGAERTYRLVQQKFYDQARFFRVVRDFVVQFGINGDPAVHGRWRAMTIQDDPVRESNKRGTVTFATSGPNSRTTQVFINFSDNTRLDAMGFAPFGRVVEGMEEVVDRLYNTYGEAPRQNLIETQGNKYLEESFPRLDYIRTARIVP